MTGSPIWSAGNMTRSPVWSAGNMTGSPVWSAVSLEDSLPLESRRQAPRAGNEEGFRKPAGRAAHPGLHMRQKKKKSRPGSEAAEGVAERGGGR